jgi:metal-responsive CopG/Arc/MetJ family transcriptional regulator
MQRKREQLQRVNVQLPRGLRDQVEEYAARVGESVSGFLRTAAEERLALLKRQQMDDRLRAAYVELSGENVNLAREHEAVDREDWE